MELTISSRTFTQKRKSSSLVEKRCVRVSLAASLKDNDVVRLEQKVKKTFYPVRKDQTKIKWAFYTFDILILR